MKQLKTIKHIGENENIQTLSSKVYVLVARLDYDDLMSKLNDGNDYYVGDMKVKTKGERLQCYKHSGCKCNTCGKEGTVVLAQRHPADKSAHINLYTVGENGNLIMMTVDHTIPRSMGGANHHNNYKPMCQECNLEKGPSCSLKDLLDYNSNNLNKCQNSNMFVGNMNKILNTRSTALSNGIKHKVKNIRKEQLVELKKLIKNGYKLPFDFPI